MRIAPSILAADLADLAGALHVCERAEAELVHFDVMDGHFVPNLTFGIPVLEALAKRTRIGMDVHLMVEEPDRLLDAYVDAGAARIAVHWEATPHIHRTLGRLREAGVGAGVAVNPATPVEVLADLLDELDFALLMSVNPGFAGQAFIPRALDKARRLGAMVEDQGAAVEIALDGGVGPDNIAAAARAGVTTCVVGSALFRTPDPVATAAELRRRAREVEG